MSDEQDIQDMIDHKQGLAIADLLGLKLKPNGRYDTNVEYGDKSPIGLALTVKRVLAEAEEAEQPIEFVKTVTKEDLCEDWFCYDPKDIPDTLGGLVYQRGETQGVIQIQADGSYYVICCNEDICTKNLLEAVTFLGEKWL